LTGGVEPVISGCVTPDSEGNVSMYGDDASAL